MKTSAVTKDGFSINPSAKTVLIQDVFRSKDGLKIMGDINEYTGGIAGVKQALKVLNEDNDADYHSAASWAPCSRTVWRPASSSTTRPPAS